MKRVAGGMAVDVVSWIVAKACSISSSRAIILPLELARSDDEQDPWKLH